MLRQQAALVHLLEDLAVVHVAHVRMHLNRPWRLVLAEAGSRLSIGVLQFVGQLAPFAVEEFDPVLVGGVVRGGDHHSGVGVQVAHQPGYAGRRHHTQVDDVHAAGHQPGVQRLLQHGAGLARVAADDHGGFPPLAADHAAGSLAQAQVQNRAPAATGPPRRGCHLFRTACP